MFVVLIVYRNNVHVFLVFLAIQFYLLLPQRLYNNKMPTMHVFCERRAVDDVWFDIPVTDWA